MTFIPHNFSPTQYEAFTNTCERYWYLRWRQREPVPPKDFQVFGTQVHKAIEIKIDPKIVSLTPLPEETADFVRAVEHHLPPPDEDDVQTELKVNLQTHLGIPWWGQIDLLRPSRRPIILRDWKTLSDFRYVLTPEELRRDIQLNSYAEFVFQIYEEHDEDHGGVIDAGLVYLKTEGKKKKEKRKHKKLPQVLPITTELYREQVRTVWEDTKPILDRMVVVAQLDDFNNVTPNTLSCGKYGGCPFRSKCGLEAHAPGLHKKEKSQVSFLDRIKNQNKSAPAPAKTETKPEVKAETEAPASTTQPAAGGAKGGFLAKARAQAGAGSAAPRGPEAKAKTAPPPDEAAPKESIVPHDAPPRDSVAPLEAGDPGHKKSAKAQTEDTEVETVDATQDDANVEAEATSGKKRPGRPKGSNGKREFVLFIDTIMVKGGGKIEPTALEDWFSPISMALDEMVKEDANLPSWWLLPFAEQKAALSMMVQESIIKGLPPMMMVSSSSAITRDLLPMLLPHATQVFKSLRG